MGQNFSFGFSDTLLTEVGGVSEKQLHFDVEAILRAYENIRPLAKRLGIEPPIPRLAGFCYPHVISLGVEVVFPEDGEPKPSPIIHAPEDIDRLTEPEDYLVAPLIQERLRICAELKKRCPQSPNFIGHPLEGPITTAVLLMGPDFLTLPYDDPQRAHKLLEFCTKSALNYARAISEYFGESIQPGPKGIPDDFAGMFPPKIFKEFVVPYWEQIFEGLKATQRSVHSELLRLEHLEFLKELKIDYFDPSADQYLTPEILHSHCPCKFQSSILEWVIFNSSAEELEAIYRKLAKFKPYNIAFSMSRLEDEPKIKHLLDVAREMKG
ncbi:hypothetical protein AUJ66_01130 [Candidatus Desantisbacteria bacterium CG1_02_38_46]|uniref:Uroporphyrinogen decarboxylase (URO-D) domain-containing protein n=3 Tax=unclassified Candidatus Desantisiibacteriota TaxID=3106372 RepID=A0A1J4SG26_9BACT|nr:MAG: hypothetical protein AUJ66_01130 [Candidatus Desantisbacteria bacterium CG1_02_38_46]PIU51531.1 MAG: hypothetical protein COS91_03910 [Candidatus Desantisbacteria bacterium CG07_land_8_20_14_0_80_39_15]